MAEERAILYPPLINMDKNLVLVSGACVFKDTRGGRRWLVVRQDGEDSQWEIPKVLVRKTESSARAAIRLMAEQGGMHAQVLEEAGRAGGSTTVNGKVVPQRYLYYLMIQKSAGEMIGFEEFKWLDYAKAQRKLFSKREKLMLRQARQELRKWEKRQQNKK
jgi:8-oxo-dGTP pyrophosphatase MutT (NUDIX family)